MAALDGLAVAFGEAGQQLLGGGTDGRGVAIGIERGKGDQSVGFEARAFGQRQHAQGPGEIRNRRGWGTADTPGGVVQTHRGGGQRLGARCVDPGEQRFRDRRRGYAGATCGLADDQVPVRQAMNEAEIDVA